MKCPSCDKELKAKRSNYLYCDNDDCPLSSIAAHPRFVFTGVANAIEQARAQAFEQAREMAIGKIATNSSSVPLIDQIRDMKPDGAK